MRDIDNEEREALRSSGIHVFTMHDVDRRGMADVMDEALLIVSRGNKPFHLSLDIDALDPRQAPGVGTPVPGGISYREAHLAMELIAQTNQMASMDVVEVNPILDAHNATAELAAVLTLSAFGKRIF